MDFQSVIGEIPKTAVVLNENNVNTGVVAKHSSIIHNAIYWHKIIIHNSEKLDRDVVLKNLTAAVHPLDLIPVFYQGEKDYSSFLVRNCGPAIVKLCRQNLLVQNPDSPNKPFKLVVVLMFSTTAELKINVQDNILLVLNKRFNTSSRILNLELFYKDGDLTEFCILSQPKIMYFVLHLAKSLHPSIIKLGNNEIQILNSLHALYGAPVTSIDLRNNAIDDVNELKNLTNLPITELFLDGNPFCDKFNESSYVQLIKEICPKVEKLDGVILSHNGVPAFRRNFLCDQNGLELVDQFVEHYFTLWDSKSRHLLETLYHKNAMFTITASYLVGHISSPTASLKKYIVISRNLKTLADISRTMVFLHTGNQTITKVFCNMPQTEHDPFTFTVDLLHYSEKYAIVLVTGVYKELPDTLLDTTERYLGFSRKFVLLACPNGEYQIINEQLHVTNATTAQHVRAFKTNKKPNSNFLQLPPARTDEEKRQLEEALKTISTMNLEWSQKCLDECHYDLKDALKLFVDLYKKDKIPEEAFEVQ